jgi:hypothetical protein
MRHTSSVGRQSDQGQVGFHRSGGIVSMSANFPNRNSKMKRSGTASNSPAPQFPNRPEGQKENFHEED